MIPIPFADYENFAACVADNQDKENPEGYCAWLHYETTGEWPGEASQSKQAKAKEGNNVSNHQLTGPIVNKNEEERFVFAPVLIPDEPDHSGDVVSKEKIRKLAHTFMEKYGNVDLQHTLNNVAKPVENYVTDREMTYKVDGEEVVIPEGSWLMGVKVYDDDTWDMVKKGKLSGFSIMAVNPAVMKALREQGFESPVEAAKAGMIKTKQVQKATLEDLDEDYIVNFVSLVDEPDVPKAKYLAIKSKKGKTDPEGGEANISDNNSTHKGADDDVNSGDDTGTNDAASKELAGSLEDKLKEAIFSYYNTSDDDAYLWIRNIFIDYVVYEIDDQPGEIDSMPQLYKIDYEIQNGGVVLSGEPVPVEIEEVLVPKSKGKGKATVAVKDNDNNSEERVNKSMSEEEKNTKTGEEESAEKNKETETEEVDVQETVKSLVNTVDSLADEVKSIKKELNAESTDTEEETEEEAEKSKDTETESAESKDNETLKSLQERLDAIEKGLGISKQPKGQDKNEAAEKGKNPWAFDDRDPLGCKKNLKK